MSLQHSHSTSPFSIQTFPLIIIGDGLQSPANVGSLFRISDAFGVSKIIFCNTSININSSRLVKTARNTHNKVPYTISNDILSEIKKLTQEGYEILALEITNDSLPLGKLSVHSSEKKALIIGNESTGISEDLLGMASQVFHIPMFGTNSSMNVVQATAIALYELTKN